MRHLYRQTVRADFPHTDARQLLFLLPCILSLSRAGCSHITPSAQKKEWRALNFIRFSVRAGSLSGLPSSLEWSGGRGVTALPVFQGFALALGGGPLGERALPGSRDKRNHSRGFGPVVGTRCRSSPRNRVTESRTRRCQRSIVRPFG